MQEEHKPFTEHETEPAPADNSYHPRKSRHGRAPSQGKDRNRDAKQRMLSFIRYGGPGIGQNMPIK